MLNDLLKKIVGAPTEAKSASVETIESLFGWLGYNTSSQIVVDKDTALEVPAVLAAVRVIAEGVGAMPPVLKERNLTGQGRWKTRPVRSDHWASRLLTLRPNSWQTPQEFIEGMTLCAALTGEAIAIKNVVRGEVRELLPVPPGCYSVEQDKNWGLRYIVHYSDKLNQTYTQDQVFVLRGPALNSYKVMPVVKMAAEAIGLSAALQYQQASLAGNGGQPAGILSKEAALSDEARERLRETWNERFGARGRKGVAILDGGFKFQSMVMTSVDGQVLESRRFQIEEIARAFGVMPLKIMQADKAATYASTEQMQRIHVLDTLMPWVRRWEWALHRDVLRSDPVMLYDFDESALMRGDHKDQAEYFQKALGSGGVPGWMSVNEVRDTLGLAPIDEEWADQIPRGSQSENLNEDPHSAQQDTVAGDLPDAVDDETDDETDPEEAT